MTKSEFEVKAKQFQRIFGFKPYPSRLTLFGDKNWILDHTVLYKLDKSIPNYDGGECMYKGKPNYSIEMAIKEEYGDEAVGLLNEMLK